MELYTFFVFLSVIVMPDGELKTLSRNVVECPSMETVLEMHKPKLGLMHFKYSLHRRTLYYIT